MIPIRGTVLVKPFPPEKISEGGLLIPESARKQSNKVTVVSVGNGTSKKPMKLKAGDIGFRVRNWGTEIIVDGEKHYLMDQEAILALN